MANNKQTMRDCLEQMVYRFKEGEIEHALLTTFNFDPGFFEKNVLPLICGISQKDAEAMSVSALSSELFNPLKSIKVAVAYDQSVLQGIRGNFRYELLPQSMPDGYFHAKMIVLAGVDSTGKPLATVMVSSGNLTLSGWGSNIEVAAYANVNVANAMELRKFYEFLRPIGYESNSLETGLKLLTSITTKEKSPVLCIQHPGSSQTMLARILYKKDTEPVHIFSPYWGKDALDSISNGRNIFCYPAKDEKGFRFPVSYEDCKNNGWNICGISGEENFRHAKAYCQKGRIAVGSANCTHQALQTLNNVEAMLVYEGIECPDMAKKSVPLTNWNEKQDPTDAPVTVPFEVLVFADFTKEQPNYTVQVKPHPAANISTDWEVEIGNIRQKLNAQCDSLPIQPPVAKKFSFFWMQDGENHFFTGMVVPIGGTDIELGYRPKRSVEQILQDMLRNRTLPQSGNGKTIKRGSDDDSDVDSDNQEFKSENEFEFDLYGMYQSFYQLGKNIHSSSDGANTLHELIHAVESGEVKHPVQQWLLLQESLGLAQTLKDAKVRKSFDEYGPICDKIEVQIMGILKSDSRLLTEYGVSPEKFMKWVSEELTNVQ